MQPADQGPDFGRDIRPIFCEHCSKCHGAEKQLSGYRLDVRAKALAGGESGEAAIVAGKPDTSPFMARIASDDKDARMPPEGERLSAGRGRVGASLDWRRRPLARRACRR